MTIIKEVTVAGQTYPVTISDENRALLDAKAAGRAIIGIWSLEAEGTDFSGCLYLVREPGDVTEELLERTVRRHLDMPWTIAQTKRLHIREFAAGDPLEEPSADDGDGVFSDGGKREAYRSSQYRFYECGMWALERREDGQIIGKAGLTDGELAYHVFPPFRRCGYAREACEAILEYGRDVMGLDCVFLRAAWDNQASVALALELGFTFLRRERDTVVFRRSIHAPSCPVTVDKK